RRDARALVVLLARQEDHADAVLARCGERDLLARAFATEERVGDLDQDAGAVAGQRIAAARAPVRQVLEDREALLDDVVRALALDVDDEADAARVALGPQIQEGSRFPHVTLSPRAPSARRSGADACRAAARRSPAARAGRAPCASTARSSSPSAPRPRSIGSG